MLTVMNASIVKKSIGVLKPLRGLTGPCTCLPRRAFSTFRPLTAIKPFLLSDPGEGTPDDCSDVRDASEANERQGSKRCRSSSGLCSLGQGSPNLIGYARLRAIRL